MIDQHLLLTLSLREHDGTPLQSRLSEREVACWISNRALRPEYRVRRGTCDLAGLAVPVATRWHCAHTVVSEAQVPGATEAVEKNTTTSVCLVLKVFITVHFGSKLQCSGSSRFAGRDAPTPEPRELPLPLRRFALLWIMVHGSCASTFKRRSPLSRPVEGAMLWPLLTALCELLHLCWPCEL
jgi:hypothetical protein